MSATLLGCSPPKATPVDSIDGSSSQRRAPSRAELFDPIEAPRMLARDDGTPLPSPDLSWDGAPVVDLGDAWVHPLSGERILPDSDGHSFGAYRGGKRPQECGRGHCGVDLGHQRGSVVHAVLTGVVRSVVQVPRGRAGKFVSIDHPSGARTFYMHLDWIRADLESGQTIRAGEPLGTLGSTGVVSSGPHLHFAMSQHFGEQMWFVDPEPMLRAALIHEGPASLTADMAVDSNLIMDAGLEAVGGIALEVRDAHTRSALDGVHLRGRGPDGATIDQFLSGGYAELTALKPGRWKLTVSRPGHTQARINIDVPAGRERVTVRGARVELYRGAVLAGVVRDQNGDRVARATVTIGGIHTQTDDHGEFRLNDAPVGRRRLQARRGSLRGVEVLALDPGDERVTLELTIGANPRDGTSEDDDGDRDGDGDDDRDSEDTNADLDDDDHDDDSENNGDDHDSDSENNDADLDDSEDAP